jgi:hypothetical protein
MSDKNYKQMTTPQLSNEYARRLGPGHVFLSPDEAGFRNEMVAALEKQDAVDLPGELDEYMQMPLSALESLAVRYDRHSYTRLREVHESSRGKESELRAAHTFRMAMVALLKGLTVAKVEENVAEAGNRRMTQAESEAMDAPTDMTDEKARLMAVQMKARARPVILKSSLHKIVDTRPRRRHGGAPLPKFLREALNPAYGDGTVEGEVQVHIAQSRRAAIEVKANLTSSEVHHVGLAIDALLCGYSGAFVASVDTDDRGIVIGADYEVGSIESDSKGASVRASAEDAMYDIVFDDTEASGTLKLVRLVLLVMLPNGHVAPWEPRSTKPSTRVAFCNQYYA